MIKKKSKEENVFFAQTPEETAFLKSQVSVRTSNDLTKSILNVLDSPDQHAERLAFEADPIQVGAYASIYRPKMRLLPDVVLKRIAIQDSLVSNIARARQNHISVFGRPRPDRFSNGFIIRPNTGVLETLSEGEKLGLSKKIANAVKLLTTCGHTDKAQDYHQKSFSEYLSVSARDAVIVGRIATEIVYETDLQSLEKKFLYFVATDAGTIYQATPGDAAAKKSIREQAYDLIVRVTGKKQVKEPKQEQAGQQYDWVQVLEGTPKQVFTSEEMKCKNFFPVTNYELDGYPVTPIDTVINAVTTHINITTHNKVYFQSGRATRGMLVIKSDDINQSVVNNIKQSFNANINGAASCLDGSSGVWTKQYGQIRIDELEGKLGGVGLVDVWTGKVWAQATAYKAAVKDLVLTTTANGITQRTSKDHKFTIIDENGDFVWRKQSELKVGDFVASNKRAVEGTEAPKFNGSEISPDLLEVLGWMSGDGCLEDSKLRLFYHQDKEVEVRDRHLAILKGLGISAKVADRDVSVDEQEKVKTRYGFKTCAAKRVGIEVNSVDFCRFLNGIGFNYSKDGKNVPSWLYTTQETLRNSYLKGLFSADGHNHKLISPCITIRSNTMREQVKLLLGACGIRTTFSEGKTIKQIKGRERVKVEAKSILRIKDRSVFFEKIGFLQPHKQPRLPKGTNKGWGTSSSIADSAVVKYLKEVKTKTVGTKLLTKRQQMDIDAILRGEDSCSLNRLVNYLQLAGISAPQWMEDYFFEPIVKIEDAGIQVQMYDMEVKDNFHAFMCNGQRLSNSWRMPVFSISTDAEINWQPIDTSGSRDMEFQYLTDLNAREILTAFMMSPDELPGWSFLSRGTSSQAMSDSNNEFKLEASRDVGIRPLVAAFEDFINAELFPLIDPELSKICRVQLFGLDADTPEKEIVNIQQNSQVWMHYNNILERVEQPLLDKRWCSEIPLNPVMKGYIDTYLTVGEIMEQFMGVKGAAADPEKQWYRDPLWIQWQQTKAQLQQAQMQAQQAQAQQAAPQQDPNQPQQPDPNQQKPEDLSRGIDQAYELMSKSEANLSPEKRRILHLQNKSMSWLMKGFEDDVQDAIKEVLEVTKNIRPKK